MTIDRIGLELFVVGVVIFVGLGGLPPGGADRYHILLKEYRDSVDSGVEPTPDQKLAHYTHVYYRLGTVMVFFGMGIWLISTLIKILGEYK